MSDLHVRYLLVGGGVAASEAAQAIRSIDAEGDVLLVGQESSRPYLRPPLSKQFLRGSVRREDLFTLASEWFVDHGVQLRTGRRASQLDVSRSCVLLDNGEEISFEHLLVATGGGAATLNVPGAGLPNLLYFRTMQDAERLQSAAEKSRGAAGRVVVIGGGLLGCELAGSLAQIGLHVELALARELPIQRFAGETAGKCLLRWFESHGVSVHPSQAVTELQGDGRVQRVVLQGGKSLNCDFAVAAVGLAVNKELLRGTPISAEKAILVDEHCLTNVPNIYAAGDCAAIFDPLFGKHRLLEHWHGAAATGKIAGTNMAGGQAAYNAVSFFDSEILGLKLAGWGEARFVQRRLVRGGPTSASPQFLEIGVDRDGRIVHILTVGHHEDKELLADLVRQKVATAGNEESIKDPAVPLRGFLRA